MTPDLTTTPAPLVPVTDLPASQRPARCQAIICRGALGRQAAHMSPECVRLTANAARAEDLTEQDYREIYQELRSKMSLRAFKAQIGSQYSIGYWSKYETHPETLTRAARQELRAAVGLPALPPAPTEALAAMDPDATIYRVGALPATRVALIGADIESVTLHVNGQITALPDPALDWHVTAATRPRPRKPTKAIRLCPDHWERLNTMRRDAGLTWDDFAAWVLDVCGA